jgi:hypothetical protein
MNGWTKCVFFLTVILAIAFPKICSAHREDYIDETLVFLTLERKSFEPEYWFDMGRETAALRDFYRHSVAVEYGITEHWMLDGRSSFKHDTGLSNEFESARLESRYRFGDEGDRPVDVAVSGEFNVTHFAFANDEFGFEPRLIFSKDIEQLNLTVNLPVEIPLDHGTVSTVPAFGIRYDVSEAFRFGSEVKYDTDRKAGSVIPQIWLGVSESLTFKAGYSLNFAHNRERFLRVALEMEL